MLGGARRLAASVLVLLASGCGVTLDLDPRAPAPGSTAFDAGRSRMDGGRRRDAGPGDAGPGDAGPMVDGYVRECASNADCFDPCSVGRMCGLDGRCTLGTPRDCDDGDFCTVDTCGAAGCVNERPAVDPCDDGDACTTQRCTRGLDAITACVIRGRTNCDDGVDCTYDTCNPMTGACANVADDGLCPLSELDEVGTCDSASGCQYPTCSSATCVADGCNDATCVGAVCMRTPRCGAGQMCCAGDCVAAGCDDGNPCTTEYCSTTGCLSAELSDGSACPVSDLCSVGGTCTSGACVPGGARSCDDGNPCTADSCDPMTGACVRSTATTDGDACDDADPCTTDDACMTGLCRGGPSPCTESPLRCKPVTCTPTGASGYVCGSVVAPMGTRCGAQMTCNLAGDCVCDAGLTDCDGDGLSCECPLAACATATGTCSSPIDACLGVRCGAILCCPTTGDCYVPTCLACCPAATH